MQTDLEKLRPRLQAAIDQGRKIETITGTEEWQFLKDFLEQSYQELVTAIMNGDFMNEPNREAFHKGMAKTLRFILDSTEEFRTKGEAAQRQLREREKMENESE